MAIVIPLQLEGKDDLRSGFKDIAGAVKEFREEVTKLRADLKKPLNVGRGSGGGSGGGAAGYAQRLGQAAQQARGPVAGLARAYQQLRSAHASGDPGQLFDAQYATHLATRRLRRAQASMRPRTTWDLVKDAVMTSRVGTGGGVMPLVNRLVPILGKAGPLGIAAVALVGIVAATKRAVDALETISKAQRQLSANRYAAGATYSQVSQMEGLGQALGSDGSSVAQASRQFAEVIAGGGWASGQWRSRGISDVSGPYGKVNKFDNLERAIKVLTELPERDAIRLARESGLEQFLPLRDASPDKLREFMAAQKKLLTPESARAAADFNIELARLRMEFQALVPLLSPVVSVFATYVSGIRKTVELGAHFAGIYGKLLTGDLVGASRAAGEALSNIRKNSRKDTEQAARDRNTEAVNENTRELSKVREVIGGGSRTRNAMPGAWRYEALNRQLDALGTALGGM